MAVRIVAGKIIKEGVGINLGVNHLELDKNGNLEIINPNGVLGEPDIIIIEKEDFKALISFIDNEHRVNIACDNLQCHHNEEGGCISNGTVIRIRKGTPECIASSNV